MQKLEGIYFDHGERLSFLIKQSGNSQITIIAYMVKVAAGMCSQCD